MSSAPVILTGSYILIAIEKTRGDARRAIDRNPTVSTEVT